MYEVAPGVYNLDQMIGIYYVHVPIRMTVLAVDQGAGGRGGLLVYAPVAPTEECTALMAGLVDRHGPVLLRRRRAVLVPGTAPRPVPGPAPLDEAAAAEQRGGRRERVAIRPRGDRARGPDRQARPRLAVPGRRPPPQAVGDGARLRRRLRRHGRATPRADGGGRVRPRAALPRQGLEGRGRGGHPREQEEGMEADSAALQLFLPRGDLGPGPILEALKTPGYKDGWGGWRPFSWGDDEARDFETFSAGGKPTVLPIIQIILSRDSGELRRWIEIVERWDFSRIVPMHLDAPLAVKPKELRSAFRFLAEGETTNRVRFCDEDVEFLRKAEEGPLSFSVYKTPLGAL
ncbi:hypothetical protein THAOC_10133 [Thalassiosira oceanica]|uniref:Uncharacterized protein n=1 Tax=Thalassiosira oceanica TaxID=159749 RepID=K0TDR4_THAOC|nr:hypothetical protein THAOC_10133 [Thalassiosira oceanica]|eukprot:EJK68667.1 hypothetical protein THAOC_10133 [Thalassiosira oceanica]